MADRRTDHCVFSTQYMTLYGFVRMLVNVVTVFTAQREVSNVEVSCPSDLPYHILSVLCCESHGSAIQAVMIVVHLLHL